MKKVPVSFIVAGAVIILLFAVLLIVGIPYFFQPPQFSGSSRRDARFTDRAGQSHAILLRKDRSISTARTSFIK